jgi:hypothetical protein
MEKLRHSGIKTAVIYAVFINVNRPLELIRHDEQFINWKNLSDALKKTKNVRKNIEHVLYIYPGCPIMIIENIDLS